MAWPGLAGLLKSRIIPTILHRSDGSAVKGRQFDSWRSVGSALNVARVHARREVDELVILDIGATPEGRSPNFDLIRQLAGDCFCPLTVGGGIGSLDHIRELLRCGADKVAIRTAALRDPDLITRAAERFGRQAVTVAIDFVEDVFDALPHGGPERFIRRSDVIEFAKRCELLGAGELLVTSVSRDGCLCGYDLELIKLVSAAVGIPVVAAGGAGSYEDLHQAILSGAHAVAAGALWQFCDCTPIEAAEYLHNQGIPVRLDRDISGDAWRKQNQTIQNMAQY